MLFQNVIVLLSSEFCLGIGKTFSGDKSIFHLKQQVGYKSQVMFQKMKSDPIKQKDRQASQANQSLRLFLISLS